MLDYSKAESLPDVLQSLFCSHRHRELSHAAQTGIFPVLFQDMDVLKTRNKLWYESLKEFDVKTLVLFPLVYNGDTKGYIWVTDFDVENALKIRETLELTTYFMAYAVANYQLLNRLEVMSSVDLLTGIYNRNAMNHRVDRYIAGKEPTPKEYGIVFADLNGLKQVNDNGGHIAGDKLLKDAAEVLRTTFYDSDIYRAGGDEFMIIAVNISEDELEKRMEKLRKDSEDPNNISFAVGGFYEENGGDIRFAMRTPTRKAITKSFPSVKENKKQMSSSATGLFCTLLTYYSLDTQKNM